MDETPDLFFDKKEIEVKTGYEFSENDLAELEKVKEVSLNAYDTANLAALNCTANVNIMLFVKKVLDAASLAEKNSTIETLSRLDSREAAEKAASDMGDHVIEAVLKAAEKAGKEIHRVTGFLRFTPIEVSFNQENCKNRAEAEKTGETMYLARCAPDHFILPAIADHFFKRFGGIPWAVIDEKRKLILIRRKNNYPVIEEMTKEDEKIFFAFDAEKDIQIENLWKLYHKTILIENRKNLKLQQQFIPLRYRKYLTEFE